MQKILALALTIVIISYSVPAASSAQSVENQIRSMKLGTRIEIQLKSQEKLTGSRGEVSATGFTLISKGNADRHIAFSNVTSVRKKSNVKRNVIIAAIVIVGAAAAVVVTFVALAKTHTIGV